MSETFQNRRQQLVRELKRRQLDCLLVTHPANWYYLTAFTGDSGALVVDRAGATLITDGRFTTQAKQESPGIGIQPQNGALFPSVGSWVAQRRLHRVGYDPQQWTVSQLKAFRIASGREMPSDRGRGNGRGAASEEGCAGTGGNAQGGHPGGRSVARGARSC